MLMPAPAAGPFTAATTSLGICRDGQAKFLAGNQHGLKFSDGAAVSRSRECGRGRRRRKRRALRR